MRRMRRIGITGNIGCGKSTAAAILAGFGAHVIDADAVVHRLLDPGSSVYDRVIEAFGQSVTHSDGRINRRALGDVVFADPDKRALLNSLIHPEVLRVILRRIDDLEKEDPDGVAVVDAALLVETGLHEDFETLIVVTCPPEIQVERIMRRDGLGPSEAQSRMAAQMPAEEKAKVADYRIDNSGSKDDTRGQLRRIYDLILANRHRHRERTARQTVAADRAQDRRQRG